jgi:hypothetical protein
MAYLVFRRIPNTMKMFEVHKSMRAALRQDRTKTREEAKSESFQPEKTSQEEVKKRLEDRKKDKSD